MVSVSGPVTATVAPALARTVAAWERATVRRLTRPSEAAAISSATLVSATRRPRPITTRCVARCQATPCTSRQVRISAFSGTSHGVMADR
jgi:hypothetical protein